MNSKLIVPLIWFCVFFSMMLACGVDDPSEETDGGLTWIVAQQQGVDSTVYYVSPAGSDENSGTTEEQAFKTLEQAFQKVHPGGQVRILPGSYHEALGLEKLGHAAAKIRIVGWNGNPVVTGQNKSTIGILAKNCKNLEFENITFQNFTDFGIGASACDNITFRNLIVKENGHAVQLKSWEIEGYGIQVEDSKNVLVENNDVFRNGPDPQIFPDYMMGTGIDTYGNHNCIIRNNHSHDNIGGGILVEDSFDVLVEGNTVDGNDLDVSADEWWDGGLWLDGGARVTVQDNIFFNNKGPGIEISDEDKQHPVGYVLKNNKSYNNYYGIFIWNFGVNDWPASNILSSSGNSFTDNSRKDVWIVDWY